MSSMPIRVSTRLGLIGAALREAAGGGGVGRLLRLGGDLLRLREHVLAGRLAVTCGGVGDAERGHELLLPGYTVVVEAALDHLVELGLGERQRLLAALRGRGCCPAAGVVGRLAG